MSEKFWLDLMYMMEVVEKYNNTKHKVSTLCPSLSVMNVPVIVTFSVSAPLSRPSKKIAFADSLSTGMTNTKSVLSEME
jgi:hypothetical protein